MFINESIIIEAINVQEETFRLREVLIWLKNHYPMQFVNQICSIKMTEYALHIDEIIAEKLQNTDKVIEIEYEEDLKDFYPGSTIHKLIKR